MVGFVPAVSALMLAAVDGSGGSTGAKQSEEEAEAGTERWQFIVESKAMAGQGQ